MKEKACAEQLRSLSDRANPSQEHAQTLGKVKQAVQDLYFPGNLWHSCSSSCEHWSHGSILCQTLMNRSSVCLCRTFPSPPAAAALPHLTAHSIPGRSIAPFSNKYFAAVRLHIIPHLSWKILSEIILLQEHWRAFIVIGSNRYFKYSVPNLNQIRTKS